MDCPGDGVVPVVDVGTGALLGAAGAGVGCAGGRVAVARGADAAGSQGKRKRNPDLSVI